ncbi:MAG: helix-turn-helix transcriptional regulator [Clostridia bacterium]|nr:helix-turn-helix transcriptional regulator [Clostridia bacterium]
MSNRISERIKKLRQQKGWTQNELGEKVGYSPQTISAWERGQNQPDIQAVSALCELFEVTSDQLLGIGETAQAFFVEEESDAPDQSETIAVDDTPTTQPIRVKTPPTFSEIKNPPRLSENRRRPVKHTGESDISKITDSFEQDCGASKALKILIIIYGALVGVTLIVGLTGKGSLVALYMSIVPLNLALLDITIYILFFIAKQKNHSILLLIIILGLVFCNVMSLVESATTISETLSAINVIVDCIITVALPFAFHPSGDLEPKFVNYLKAGSSYFISCALYLFLAILLPVLSSALAFLMAYPVFFLLYFTLYRATKNKKSKYFYDTVRHKEQTVADVYQSKAKAPSKLGSAYARSTMAEDERKRTNALPYASTPHNPDASCVYKEIADEKSARVADFLVEKPVLSTVFLVLLLTLNIPVMLIVGNIYPPDNVLFYFSIILVFFAIIPTFNTLCYLFFRQGSKKLRVTLCAVYTFCSIFLNAVFFEYTFNYYIPSTLVVLAMLGVGAISIVQLFTLSDHDYLSVSARVTLKVSYTFIESIVLGFLTYLYLVAETHQVAILLLVWWQLIFFSICCTLKAPLTKQIVNYIYR